MVESVRLRGFSLIGIGTWKLAGRPPERPPADTDVATTLLLAALESGFGWIDTAGVYGLGWSEELVRSVVMTRGSQVPLITKVGIQWHANDNSVTIDRSVNAASIRKDLDASIQRLGGLGSMAGVCIHSPDQAGTSSVDGWRVLSDARASGEVGFIGLSNHQVGETLYCNDFSHVDFVQVKAASLQGQTWSTISREFRRNQISVIVYGLLQHRKISRDASPGDRLRSIGDALRWAFYSGADHIVIGASSLRQLTEINSAAAQQGLALEA